MKNINKTIIDSAKATQEKLISTQCILLNLSRVMDDYWNGKRNDNQIKLICFWQQKAKNILDGFTLNEPTT